MSEREIFRSFLFMEELIKLVIAEKPSVAVTIAKVTHARTRKKTSKETFASPKLCKKINLF
ncbi:hypothetical protein QP555_06725 [Peptoniphilus lacrimalis]|nr:hypothetical protein [Peptoniphilus lacrimalis]MDK7732314.1 hypothetical protein [Peptoniphilus lacrimalis]